MPLAPTIPDLETLALMLGTQLVLTLYGAGLRRPFGSLRTVRTAPSWLRETPALVLAGDLAFAAFVVAMWIHLFDRLDLVELPHLVLRLCGGRHLALPSRHPAAVALPLALAVSP